MTVSHYHKGLWLRLRGLGLSCVALTLAASATVAWRGMTSVAAMADEGPSAVTTDADLLQDIVSRFNELFAATAGEVLVCCEMSPEDGLRRETVLPLPMRLEQSRPGMFTSRHRCLQTTTDAAGRSTLETREQITEVFLNPKRTGSVLLTETVMAVEGPQVSDVFDIVPLGDNGLHLELRTVASASIPRSDWIACDWTRSASGRIQGIRRRKDSDIVAVWVQQHRNDLDRIYRFLVEHVMNRLVRMESEGTIAGGAVACSFARDTVFCNLQNSSNGLDFDIIDWIQQKNWDLRGGNKVEPPRIQDRVLITRIHLVQRRSTGDIVGWQEVVSTTQPVWNRSAKSIRAEISEASLVIHEYTNLYDDHFATDGGYYPGASEIRIEYRLKDGVLQVEESGDIFTVDPATLKKEASHKDDTTVSREVRCLPMR